MLSRVVNNIKDISIVEKKYYQTAYLFEQIEINTFDRFKFETYLDAFINSLRNITFSIQKEWKWKEWFDIWYSDIQNKLKNDNVMLFFSELRNYSIKEWDNFSWDEMWVEMRHIVSFDWKWWQTINIMTRWWEKVDEITIKDKDFNIMDPKYWYCEKIYLFKNLDWYELENQSIKSINDYCYYALKIMKDITNDYKNKFL